MNEPNEMPKKQTLMRVLERLEEKCSQLRDVANLTDKLNEKLNRIENHPKLETEKKGIEIAPLNIVQLFNEIADMMEIQIDKIGNNTELSIEMID